MSIVPHPGLGALGGAANVIGPGRQRLSETVVQFAGVEKRFEDHLVLADLNLTFSRGEFVSFIGPSGCGKSTLLRLIAGLTGPTGGQVSVEGKPPAQARENMFFVFQDPQLLPWRRVAANVDLPLMLRGDPAATRHPRVAKMIKLVGLEGAEQKYPWQLSGGMRMRVSIARALSVAPRILLLDEPFGGLDEMTRDRLNEDLLAIRQEDPFTAFFVTHSVMEAVFLSSKIVVLSANPGRVAAIVEVPFAYPRRPELRETAEFLSLLASTTRALRAVLPEHS
jgi:NitT/TauT family transport system ATP-binding protein